MLISFQNKTAIVTGGANGIGLATAKLLRSSGAEVWIFDVEAEKPQEVAASFGARGASMDVTDRWSLEKAFEAVGDYDILVANAGAVAKKNLTETTAVDWDRIIAVNLTSVFHCVQIAAEHMKKKARGSIVLTASTNSFDGESSLIAYNASKAGLLGILHTAANELGPHRIRVNAVAPGLIRTRLTQQMFENSRQTRNYFRHMPLGRPGLPDEVATAIAFLASDASSYITGVVLPVDGGQLATKYGTWDEETADFFGDRWWLK
ncbi:MAG TPA: SDR family NAD(P)-dependent oxidoreductase [Bryobacteraceae bacterium]|jgi:NAD(P)-dependent dehydrogenase (short-subunit alcohol dehydrogenase family)|nr:SDR family NAD(P)-dependent oxidoreductase [Bryobacteraceae bacterium]